MEFELIPEYISAVFIALYIVNSLLDSRVSMLLDVLYRISLYTTFAAIFFSILTAYTAMHVITVEYSVNMLANSAYFAFTFLMISMISLTLLGFMFEDRAQSVRFRVGMFIIIGLYVASFVVVALNWRTGWLFSIDGNDDYIRGPFNSYTYWLMLANALLIIVYYQFERNHLKKSFKRIAITLPTITPIMALYQLLSPNTMLTGAIATLALTTILIYGQQQRAHVDHLTALAGREMFYRTLERFAYRRKLFRVVFVSLREYKAVNNRFGQLAGDSFLREVSRFLSALDRRAVACRYSGVEFALIVPNLPNEEYARLFDTLCARFHEPWICEGNRTMLSASIVEIAYPEHAKSVNELIGSLEYAVRQAKAMRRGCVIRFDNRLRNSAGRYHYVLSQLTDQPDDRFFITLQPVHDTKSGVPRGAEVLVRLRDENGRIIMPGEFIPLAEDSGYVDDIDWLVAEKACRFISENRDCGVEWLSINFTPLMHGPAVVARIADLLEAYRLPPGMLKLECTERLFANDFDLMADTVRQLRALGVGVFLDDFGTGYSNLYMTAKLPLECVKIDRLFVRDVENDEKARRFLSTLIDTLHSMGTTVTVEGVETMAQRDVMRKFGADLLQGFYYAEPMLPGEFLPYMLKSLE